MVSGAGSLTFSVDHSSADSSFLSPPDSSDLLYALPVPVLLIDGDDRIRLVNAAGENFLNRSRSALNGMAVGDYLPALQQMLTRRAPVGPNDAGVAVYDLDLEVAGGRNQRVDVSISPVNEKPGWRLIAVHVRSVPSLMDRQVAGRVGARAASGAAAVLAHEIKNPLSGIRGAAQLVQRSVPDKLRPLTQLICDEVDRIAALVDRMEGFTDERPFQPAPQNIHAILKHVRHLADNGFAQDIKIKELYDPSLPDVAGDRDRLIQIFLNLVKNAVEAIGKSSEIDQITITTAYRHGYSITDEDGRRQALPIEICVIDTGPGVSPDIEPHLFDPFVTTKHSGKGLGLPLVAKLVADHGGAIEYSREGQPLRSVFRVLLPVYQEERK